VRSREAFWKRGEETSKNAGKWKIGSDVLWNAVKWSEVKWWSWVKCVDYHWFTVIYLYVGSVWYVISLLFASLCYFLIARLIFLNILFVFVFILHFYFLFVYYAFVLFLYCFVYCFSFCSASFLFLYKSTDHCQRLEAHLQ